MTPREALAELVGLLGGAWAEPRVATLRATIEDALAALDVDDEPSDMPPVVALRDEDVRVELLRPVDAGGQHTRPTHVPTGTSVTCESERSQHANRTRALEMLRERLAPPVVRSACDGCLHGWPVVPCAVTGAPVHRGPDFSTDCRQPEPTDEEVERVARWLWHYPSGAVDPGDHYGMLARAAIAAGLDPGRVPDR